MAAKVIVPGRFLICFFQRKEEKMCDNVDSPGKYRFIVHEYEAKPAGEGWNNEILASASANELIRIWSIHKDERVMVDVSQCTLFQGGRTLKKQHLPMYRKSFTVSN